MVTLRESAVGLFGRRHAPLFDVDGAMAEPALDRVRVVLEPSLHPLEEEQAPAVRELVDHAGRNEIRHLGGLARHGL